MKPHQEPPPTQGDNHIERLDRVMPPLPIMNNRCLLPNESAQMYYARMGPFRRICEARAVLRWMAGEQFDVAVFLTEVKKKRGDESAGVLKTDLVNLFQEVIKRDPSLSDLLYPRLIAFLADLQRLR